ncbi:MAG: Rho termination factor N-terminal domain-containing protein, partial [Cyanobacteria bacterium P01_G01_bin.4]
SFEGDLKIQIGSQTVYRNKGGDISINLLDLPGQRYTRSKSETNLEKIRVSRLREMAAELGIEQPQQLNKQQLMDSITAARSEQKETLDPLAGAYERELFELRTELESTREQLHSALRSINSLQNRVNRLSQGSPTVPGSVNNRVTNWLQGINDSLLRWERGRLEAARDRHDRIARGYDGKISALEQAINPTIFNNLRNAGSRIAEVASRAAEAIGLQNPLESAIHQPLYEVPEFDIATDIEAEVQPEVDLASSLEQSGLTTEQVTLNQNATTRTIEPPQPTVASDLTARATPTEPVPLAEPQRSFTPEQKTAISDALSAMTVSELRPLARELGNPKPHGLRKAALIEDMVKRTERVAEVPAPLTALIEDGTNRIVGGEIHSIEAQFAQTTKEIDLPESPVNVEREESVVEDEQAVQAESHERAQEQVEDELQEQQAEPEPQPEQDQAPELRIPELKRVSNPVQQFDLDVAAFMVLLRQGKSTIQAATLLNFHQVSATERPHNTHPENYVENIKSAAAQQFRLESRANKSRQANQQQQRQPKRGRAL